MYAYNKVRKKAKSAGPVFFKWEVDDPVLVWTAFF